MHAPLVQVHGVQLGRDAGLEHAPVQRGGNAAAVVHHDEAPPAAFARDGQKHVLGLRVARVAQHLDDDVLGGPDVVRRLPALRFGAPQTNEAIPEVGFDPEMAVAAH